MPRPTAIEAAKRFRAALAADEAAAAERMATVYGRIYTGLLNDMQSLAETLAAMEKLDRAKVMKLARVQELLKQVAEQTARFTGTAQSEIMVIENRAIQAGIDNALKLIEASLPDLPGGLRGKITASFTRLHADAIEAAAGLMGQDSPLRQQLEGQFGEYVSGQVERHFMDGIAGGQRASQIVSRLQRNLQEGLGSGLTSILTTLRTAQIKSYQLANHAQYLANSNVVKGWVWHAELSGACMVCTEKHGSIHPLEETLDSHYNCRCSPIPETITYADLGLDIPETVEPVETGEDWFNRQPESVQRDKMGPGMFAAFKAGKVGFGDFSRSYDDAVYGQLLREASLKDILGNKAKEFYQ